MVGDLHTWSLVGLHPFGEVLEVEQDPCQKHGNRDIIHPCGKSTCQYLLLMKVHANTFIA